MRARVLLGAAVVALVAVGTAYAAGAFNEVKPDEFDPAKTHLVNAAWVEGAGCPTNATVANPNSDFTGVQSTSPYTDPACPTGDPKDTKNEGLLLVKTGPTDNFAEAEAELKNVPSTVTELGYDLRKADYGSDRGSHCGGGAPRFIIVFQDGSAQFGPSCTFPAPTIASSSTGWVRLRWTVSYTNVKQIFIQFDEGQDAAGGPDMFGAAILDNIDVNGTLVGQGPADSGSK
jgi:hypothetical protein